MEKTPVVKNAVIQDDILRYKKNKFAANFALLALLFDILYFTLLYTIHQSEAYTMLIGASVIVNLLVMLAGFYASEGVKAYKKNSVIVLIVLAVVQVVRIFIYPLNGMANDWMNDNAYFGIIMNSAGNGTLMIIYLVGSAACFVVAAVQGFLTMKKLDAHLKAVESGEIVVEDVLKQLDDEDAGVAPAPVEAESVSDVNEEENNG